MTRSRHILERGHENARPADAVGNWVDRHAPRALRPYMRLARFDRPVGAWLLLWPCWWSIALAGAAGHGTVAPWPDPRLLVLFLVGAFVMRAAGCTYNDIVDKDYDAHVARTAGRPIPSGAVSVAKAAAFMAGLCLVGLFVLLSLSQTAIVLGVLSLLLVAIYPFAKRFTYWPQIFLGLAFNWGALMGWAAAADGLAPAPFILYLAGIAWTLHYDTIYAHQDKEDDLLVGVKSTALKLGSHTKPFLWAMAVASIAGIGLAGWRIGLAPLFYAGLAAGGGHLAWQIATLDIDDGEGCLARFRANHGFGAIVFMAIILGVVSG